MSNDESLLEGPEWEAIIAAVCAEGEAERIVEDEALRLAA